ncbi:MAG TPA: helix-turn-helix domain-containing protein [Xanthomonadaceae bacterium]|nr:helix-turn-helix domain-containing protein [Xanthomonadaceae bacterium]
MAISDDERAFFIELGQRIAQRRKALDITQVQLAEILGISQQAMNSFEKGRRRIPVSALPAIAGAIGATLDELVVEDASAVRQAAPRKRGPAPKIQQQLEQLSRLPKAKQRAVMQVLDSVLAQAGP